MRPSARKSSSPTASWCCAAQVEHEPAHARCPAAQPIAQPPRDGPHHVHRQPAPAHRPISCSPQQPQPEHHERKGRAVVEPGLAGQREAQPVAVARIVHLHVGGEHRVGGRQDRRPAAPPRPAAARAADADHRDQRHRDHHRHRQPQRREPARSRKPALILSPAVNSDTSTMISVRRSSSFAWSNGVGREAPGPSARAPGRPAGRASTCSRACATAWCRPSP